MKKILSLILTLFCVLSLVGCGRSMDDIIKNESSITGVGKFITTPYLFPSRQTLTLTEHIAMFLWMQRTKMTWLISTLVMKSLSITMVTLESYPLQINTVYAISLKDPAN